MNISTLKTTARWAMIVCLVASANRSGAQVDCLGVDGGTALPGMPCDDNDPSTTADVWFPFCDCQGVCEALGTPCNDLNPNTINDLLTSCGCMGTCFGNFGDPCDDGNAWTMNDQLWPNWCQCIGFCTGPVGAPCDDGDPLTTGEFLDPYCQCVGASNLISGQVFLDLDQNGLFDGEDVPLPNRTVRAGPGNRYTTSDQDGDFYIVVPSGTYVLTVHAGNFYEQSQTPPVVNVNGEGLVSGGHLLPMNATSLEADFSAHGCLSLVRPGFLNYIKPICWNQGSIPASGSVTLSCDAQLDIISADGNATIDGNTISWDVQDLQPGAFLIHYVQLSAPANLPIGTLLTDQVTVQADPTDNFPMNDALVAYRAVVGAMDPNDKQVTPSVLTAEEVTSGRAVEYMIRFQNTGTFLAETVRITDHLPQQVDPSSIEFIASSHTCHTTYQNGVLEFLFNDIMLPDSNANEPESHGFVLFRIKPLSTLLPGDSVWNRAYIYFDFNEPVITNAATFSVELSTAVAPNSVEVPALSLWPNPTTDVLNITLPGTRTGSALISIIDLNGRVVRNWSRTIGTSMIELPVADLVNGLYTVRIESQGKTTSHRFVILQVP